MTLIKLKITTFIGMVLSLIRTALYGVADRSSLSKKPQPDHAKDNAFFPSPLSLALYVPPKTNFSKIKHKTPYQEKRWKILTLLTEERYMVMNNGTLFSTGNHPVEMLLPLMHLDAAGFAIDIATINGKSAKLELWAMPSKDETVQEAFHKFSPQLEQPLNLTYIIETKLGEESDYLAVFIPGGHGALNNIPGSRLVQTLLDWAMLNNRFIITLCHGPGALLASKLERNDSIFAGYNVCVFPDKLDKDQNIKIGYLPGEMPWYVGEALRSIGVNVINTSIIGQVHRDRNLLTGDSPLASNNLGILAVDTLLEYIHTHES